MKIEILDEVEISVWDYEKNIVNLLSWTSTQTHYSSAQTVKVLIKVPIRKNIQKLKVVCGFAGKNCLIHMV